ncbi:unnamed protein product [Meganyctiphanes norvegica]|uniref:Dipeptidase n=1 Tax=Meganyctiphanes norvegica TaxID=48144 RepID=A0AAV2Q573_MEGNR
MKFRTIVLLLLVIQLGRSEFQSKEPQSFAKRLSHARDILDEVPLIDGHNDLVMNIRSKLYNRLQEFPFDQDLTEIEPWASMSNSHTDIPRIKAGKLGGQFWSAFVSCSSQYKNALTQTLEQIDVIHRLVERYPDDLAWVDTADGILDAHAAGKVASMIGVEGGHSMDSSLGTLRIFYNVGVRYMTLTHGCNTPWADNSQAEPDGIEFDGLTEWGEIVVKEMNRLGMFVDISHVAQQTMHDVLDVTRAPVIASHSDTRALCDVPRNVPDDVLIRIAENGGVVMVNFLPYFLTGTNNATLFDVIDHINHIRNVAGVDHVGIGSDFDGITEAPEGLEDVSQYPNLFAELMLDPLWSDDDLKKLAGLNLVRAFKEMEQVRT